MKFRGGGRTAAYRRTSATTTNSAHHHEPRATVSAATSTVGAREALHGAADEAQRRDRAATGTAHVLYALLARPDEELTDGLDGLDAATADLHAEAARRLAA